MLRRLCCAVFVGAIALYSSIAFAIGGGPPAPNPDPTMFEKSRFISFVMPPAMVDGSAETALRVHLGTLHEVDPPYSGGPTIPFDAFEGLHVWVGPPAVYMEFSHTPTVTFHASKTQCQPYYHDWSTIELLHVTGSAIVPSSIYLVESLAASCQGDESSLECSTGGSRVSPQLEIRTTRWADVETPFNPPSTSVQPDFGDVAFVITKVRGLENPKARTLLAGGDAFGNITTLNVDVGFGHIAACLDAFRGLGYPFRMGKCAGSSSACTNDSECGGDGPCNLYCP